MRSGSKGFTLIEALAAVVILGAGIAAVMGAFSSVARSEDRSRQSEVMHRLAIEKLEELRATTETFTTSESGNFEEKNLPNYTWSMEVENTGVENLEAVTVKVEMERPWSGAPSAEVTSLVFQPPPPAEGETP
jgi:prepilin-type N-terminal cleavage/methylation domain-containing protein